MNIFQFSYIYRTWKVSICEKLKHVIFHISYNFHVEITIVKRQRLYEMKEKSKKIWSFYYLEVRQRSQKYEPTTIHVIRLYEGNIVQHIILIKLVKYLHFKIYSNPQWGTY